MNYPFFFKSYSEEDTISLADIFSFDISEGDIIVLNGNLGAGKTFFIKYTLEHFKIENVTSPTFAIVNEYYGLKKFYHFDFYRINNAQELFDIGFNDYIKDDNAVTFIEWGNLFNELIPKVRKEISITINNDFSRDFYIKKYG